MGAKKYVIGKITCFSPWIVIEFRDEKKYFCISLARENFNSLLAATEHARRKLLWNTHNSTANNYTTVFISGNKMRFATTTRRATVTFLISYIERFFVSRY